MFPYNSYGLHPQVFADVAWPEDVFARPFGMESINAPFFDVIELDSLSLQTEMDEMALNNQLSHMVTSIQ